MIKHLLAASLALWAGLISYVGQARAEPDYPPHLLDKATLQEMVLAHRIDAVERDMQVARLAYAAGEADHNHLRWLNEVFGTTSPKVARFARDWLETYPDSPHAHVANAWIAYKIGWTVRGPQSATRTYHRAMTAFTEAMYETVYHAEQAFYQDPELLPATDALIYLSTMGYGTLPLDWLLDTIMAAQPNAGTVLRANAFAFQGWGYDQSYGDHICDTYGPHVPEWGDEGADICKIIHSHNRFGSEPFDWFLETLGGLDYDNAQLRLIRAKTTMRRGLDHPEWQAELTAMFDDPTFTDMELAAEFDDYFAPYHPEVPLATIRVRPRAKTWARARLKIEPYNLQAIGILSDQFVYRRAPDGEVLYDMDPKIARQVDLRDLARRRVAAKPWNGVAWQIYARHVHGMHTAEGFAHWRDALVNSAAYSNHAPYQLQSLIMSLSSYDRRVPKMSRTHRDPEVRAFLKGLDLEREVRCPIARAAIILGMLCAHKDALRPDERSTCDWLDRKAADLGHLMTPLHENRICGMDLDRDDETLLFTPVEIDLRLPGEL